MSDFYITSNQGLQAIIDAAYKKEVIAIDTEFTREKTYYPILSLVQVAVDGKSYAIDCLSDVDLAPVYDIISDKKVKKILHSCAQDLQIFHQKSKNLPNFVRDVQMMANFCGVGFNIGYSGLTEQLVGVKIDKKLQRSNWQKRPLDIQQIEYALLDVVYLEEIYLKLSEILQQRKRKNWFLEEMDNIGNHLVQRTEDELFKNFSAQKRFGNKDIKEITKIKNLILWREKMAQEKDVPRQHFLTDKQVEEIVMIGNFDIDMTKEIIDEIKFLLNKIDKEEIKIVVEKKILMNEEQKDKFRKAKDFIIEIAAENDLKEQFLVPNQILKDVILGDKKIDELIFGWRYDLFGKKLEKIIS